MYFYRKLNIPIKNTSRRNIPHQKFLFLLKFGSLGIMMTNNSLEYMKPNTGKAKAFMTEQMKPK